MRNHISPTLIVIVAAMLLALGQVAPAVAQSETEAEPTPLEARKEARQQDAAAIRAAWSARKGTIVVHHGPVDARPAGTGSDGHQLGDVRAASVATSAADGTPVGRLDIILTTTAIDQPAPGDETRVATLVFTFGESGQHQITTTGSVHLPAESAVSAGRDDTVTPIVGGSGRFAGVAGDAVSVQLEDGSWSHTLKPHKSRADAIVERALKQRLKEGLREWRAERKEARAERKAERQEARAERKAERAERKAAREAEATEPAVEASVESEEEPAG